MFNRRTFADMRRAGLGVGVSKPKMTKAMTKGLGQRPLLKGHRAGLVREALGQERLSGARNSRCGKWTLRNR